MDNTDSECQSEKLIKLRIWCCQLCRKSAEWLSLHIKQFSKSREMCFEKIKDFANSWASVLTIVLTIIGLGITIIGVVIPIETWNVTENSPPYITIKADHSDIKLDENQSIAYGRIYYDIMVTTKPDRYQFIDSTILLQADGKNVTLTDGGGFPATYPFWVLSTGTNTLDSGILIQDFHRGDNITVTMNYNT